MAVSTKRKNSVKSKAKTLSKSNKGYNYRKYLIKIRKSKKKTKKMRKNGSVQKPRHNNKNTRGGGAVLSSMVNSMVNSMVRSNTVYQTIAREKFPQYRPWKINILADKMKQDHEKQSKPNNKNNKEMSTISPILYSEELKNFLNNFKDKLHYSIEENNNIEDKLVKIYNNNPNLTLLSEGGYKKVFEIKNSKQVFKIMILNRNKLGLNIKEPLYMSKSHFCNSPNNITVYCYNEDYCTIEGIRIEHCFDLYDSAIITWYEEKAKFTGMKKKHLNDKTYSNFMEKSIPILEKDGFSDLQSMNIGTFDTEPKLRWIDLQVIIAFEKDYNCLFEVLEEDFIKNLPQKNKSFV